MWSHHQLMMTPHDKGCLSLTINQVHCCSFDLTTSPKTCKQHCFVLDLILSFSHQIKHQVINVPVHRYTATSIYLSTDIKHKDLSLLVTRDYQEVITSQNVNKFHKQHLLFWGWGTRLERGACCIQGIN